MEFKLPDLPFGKEEFNGFISKEGFDYHHGKHHAGYVKKLNNNIKGTVYEGKSLEDVILDSAKDDYKPVYNNAAQHWNHDFFWKCLTPDGKGEPTGKLADMIKVSFGSFDAFCEQFSTAANTLFGSGWVWLAMDTSGNPEVLQKSNADNPMTEGKTPLLTLDVWEHAFYIDHRNAKPEFVKKFWNYVNWDFVQSRIG